MRTSVAIFLARKGLRESRLSTGLMVVAVAVGVGVIPPRPQFLGAFGPCRDRDARVRGVVQVEEVLDDHLGPERAARVIRGVPSGAAAETRASFFVTIRALGDKYSS